jgi:hypothetical protein
MCIIIKPPWSRMNTSDFLSLLSLSRQSWLWWFRSFCFCCIPLCPAQLASLPIMKFFSLAFLLLSALLSPEFVNSRPTKPQRDGRIIRLPLKRLHNLERTDVHPLVVCDHFASDYSEAQMCRGSRYSCTSSTLIGMLSAETYAEQRRWVLIRFRCI